MPSRKKKWIIVLVTGCLLGCCAAAFVGLRKAQTRCRWNLVALQSTFNSVALLNGVREGERLETNTVLSFLPDRSLPVCPRGGKYTLPECVGGYPTCSVHGALPEDERGEKLFFKTRGRPGATGHLFPPPMPDTSNNWENQDLPATNRTLSGPVH